MTADSMSMEHLIDARTPECAVAVPPVAASESRPRRTASTRVTEEALDHPAVSVPNVRHMLPMWLCVGFSALLSNLLFGQRSVAEIFASVAAGDLVALFGVVAVVSTIGSCGLLGFVTARTISDRSEGEARRFFRVFTLCQLIILVLTGLILLRARLPIDTSAVAVPVDYQSTARSTR